MHFLLIIIYGYILVATIIALLLWRDQKKWNGAKKIFALTTISFLVLGIMVALSTVFLYPNLLIITEKQITIKKIKNTTTIIFVSDIQVGKHKKTSWVEKIVKKIDVANPDIVILGGDLISNEGTFEDESEYLEPLAKLSKKYPTYAVMGNHEYGIGSKNRKDINRQTGDRSNEVINRLNKLNITILRNQIDCPQINEQKICLFGTEDVWSGSINFDDLKKWENRDIIPLILITHNPDGIKYWTEKDIPDLVLAGHTHGGQIWIPGIGPFGLAGVEIGKKYYRELNYWNNIPIYTSVGAGESAGPIRFWVIPEIVKIDM